MQCKFQCDQGDALTKYGRIRAAFSRALRRAGTLTFAWQMLYSRSGMKPCVELKVSPEA